MEKTRGIIAKLNTETQQEIINKYKIVLRKMEKGYNKEQINQQTYSLIKEDILWLLAN